MRTDATPSPLSALSNHIRSLGESTASSGGGPLSDYSLTRDVFGAGNRSCQKTECQNVLGQFFVDKIQDVVF